MDLSDFIDELSAGRPVDILTPADGLKLKGYLVSKMGLSELLRKLREDGFSDFQIGYACAVIAKFYTHSAMEISVGLEEVDK